MISYRTKHESFDSFGFRALLTYMAHFIADMNSYRTKHESFDSFGSRALLTYTAHFYIIVPRIYIYYK
jgi:hypothetical protein